MPALYVKPTAPTDDKRWKIVETRMRRMGDRPAALIEALHAAQEAFGFLDEDALHYVGDTLGVPIPASTGSRRSTRSSPQAAGRAHLRRLHRTACYINGAKEILAGRAGLGFQGDHGRRQVSSPHAARRCSLAPAVIVDGAVRGKVSADELVDQLEAM
jgi:bidirectional [NiFe] hydrogenase diaphorase subunit